jgi:hypothetical protein
MNSILSYASEILDFIEDQEFKQNYKNDIMN